LQAGGPPLWIAGGGEKKTLRLVAQYGDYANIAGDPAGFVHKSEILRGHCTDVGRDFDDITRSANYNVVIGATQKEVDDHFEWILNHYAKTVPNSIDQVERDFRSGTLVGTPEQIVEKLGNLQGLGMTYAICYFAEAAYDTSGIELFEREVIPARAV
jgi:alkanesulfonate monooxygenase SsuD/methylene tetrahydromethanopterin reductase-like flavin-dependent oxidoreductase (luciferase family)